MSNHPDLQSRYHQLGEKRTDQGLVRARSWTRRGFVAFLMRHVKIIDEGYLAYIRKLPCLACLKPGPSDPDHVIARGWREAKRNDYSAIPLCRKCHHEFGQVGNEKFCRNHGIQNLWEEIFYLTCGYPRLPTDFHSQPGP